MSYETKHTPGPWKVGSLVSNDGSVPVRGNVNDDFEMVARAELKVGVSGTLEEEECLKGKGWTIGFGEDDERDANARLIAAAPDLLQSCREVDYYLTEFDIPCDDDGAEFWVAGLRAAIQKATEGEDA